MENDKCVFIANLLRLIAKGTLFLVLLFTSNLLLASNLLEDYFIFQENNKKGIRNADYKVVIPALYDDLGWSVGEFHPLEDLVGYKENGLWGLMTLENKKITQPVYQNLYPLNRKQIVASKLTGHQELNGIVGLDGGTLVDFEYRKFNMFNNLIVAAKSINSQLKYGILNLSFEEILPFNYTEIKTLNNRYAVIMQDQWSGVVNASGQVLVQPKYHEIKVNGDHIEGRYFNHFEIRDYQNQLIAKYQVKDLRKATPGIIVASGSNSSQVLNRKGELVKSYERTRVLDFKGNIAVIERQGLFGIIDVEGNELVAPVNKSIWIEEGFIGIEMVGGKWKLTDNNLNVISTRDYQQIMPASEGFFPIKRLDSWGFINAKGEEVIPPQYQDIESFKDGAAYASYLGSWGVIDHQGNWLIRPRYDRLEKLDAQTYLFQKGAGYGMVDTGQQEIYQSNNLLISTPTGVIEQSVDQKYALISPEGEKLLSLNYTRIQAFPEDPNYYLFEDEEGLGIFNIPRRSFFRDTTIQEMRTLDEGFIGVRINDQYGLIDLNGKLRIANRYEDVGVFSEDMLPVKIRGRWGYVDRIERLKVQPLYHTAGSFKNGVAIVSRDNKYGLLSISGKTILSMKYDRIERLPEGLFICYQGSRAGLADATGKMLIYPRYNSFNILENGNFIVDSNGHLGLVNGTGRTLIPAEYDKIVYDQHNNLYLLAKEFPWEAIDL